MAQRKSRNTGYLAAAILASIVLFVFMVLHDYGPESAIRKFHRAVLQKNLRELQAVSADKIDTPSVAFLANRVLWADQNRANYYVARTERRSDEVIAVVVYTMPNGLRFPTIWDVVKDGPFWRVDAERTETVFRDATGL